MTHCETCTCFIEEDTECPVCGMIDCRDPRCDAEINADIEEREYENDLEAAAECRCGALTISQKTGKLIQIADCIC